MIEEYLNERSHYRETGIKTKRYQRGAFIARDMAKDPPLDQNGNYRRVASSSEYVPTVYSSLNIKWKLIQENFGLQPKRKRVPVPIK